MLILKKPDQSELEVITMVRCVCCNCTNEETVQAVSKEAAAIQLQKLGWRAYETDDEIGANACPDCGSSLVQVSLRKNDLTEMALNGEFEDGERKFIVTAFGHTRVVRVFDNGEALMAQEVWNGEPLGNDCYVDSYPDDSSWFETDENNSSELLNN